MSEPMLRGHEGTEMTLVAINQTITNTESES
ncbi:hypothetical protein GNY84_01135 [Aeromonas hydrophila]|uniref:Uncharacterized protein n=1 Tax=Aeromonas hydrophila subsp. hydrophila (strain ATCC 7966 / DSM 30187 / BCRC 13018 / CCUG 14551 / JCM 1027 / KCTC 2358 / NCIMB 9240 / NCTC 8049) TaxID=380703 RepID=A0KNA2_AERHH|nr:hypothetical protein AHA_3262 [Aeromonas hydrophila subsp. hydrophila ATCC 7966]AVP85644.1 hypothetical protein C7K70_17215 [Aeromonas hydrophila]MBQ4665634.1 hypothetical protein [Aeromonas hydrophila]MBQ4716003.1 hypothetical protein [Aeromonas hydrophila]MBW3824419.1 hypothetical protein [Aeromonas hydrophila]